MTTDDMTGAEFRCAREWLGLTAEWVAGQLEVKPRAVARWDHGRNRIPADAVNIVRDASAQADAMVAAIVAERPAVVRTFATDEAYSAAHPGSPYPAAWHRAIAFRAGAQLPGARITYGDE